MLNAFRNSLLALLLVPTLSNVALAAPAKKVKKTVTTTTETSVVPATAPVVEEAPRARDSQGTLFGSGGGGMASLKGLSVFAAYDFADQLENNSGGKVDTERAFDIGAMYEFSQFTPGLAAQFGAEYDFNRATKPGADQPATKFSQITPFAELTAHLTPILKFMGGVNYNFPSVDNLPGATLKGNIGYQFGGSVAFNEHLALDARYRSVQYDVSVNGTSTSLKENGFQAAGRYMF